MKTAAIFGPEGPTVTAWEKGFFAETQPLGFILFARNVETPDQVRALTTDLRETVGWDAPVLIDQEGGRVQRMRAPHWQEYLPALDQMQLASDPIRAQWVRNRLIASELIEVGIDVNCAPLADLVEPETHPILRNRLYGSELGTVVHAALTCSEALLASGVLPVLKHIPGYGRAAVDSHLELPVVRAPYEDLEHRDFAVFRALKDIKIGMTAHIVYSALDPFRPATTSTVVMKMIREEIGFDGLMLTDDISMEALSGTVSERSSASLAAGCDVVLHCNGKQMEMAEVAKAVGPLTDVANRRAEAALAQRQPPMPIDIPGLREELDALLA